MSPPTATRPCADSAVTSLRFGSTEPGHPCTDGHPVAPTIPRASLAVQVQPGGSTSRSFSPPAFHAPRSQRAQREIFRPQEEAAEAERTKGTRRRLRRPDPFEGSAGKAASRGPIKSLTNQQISSRYEVTRRNPASRFVAFHKPKKHKTHLRRAVSGRAGENLVSSHSEISPKIPNRCKVFFGPQRSFAQNRLASSAGWLRPKENLCLLRIQTPALPGFGARENETRAPKPAPISIRTAKPIRRAHSAR